MNSEDETKDEYSEFWHMLSEEAIRYAEEFYGPQAQQRRVDISLFEAELLCRHWVEELYRADALWADHRMTSSHLSRLKPYIEARISVLETVLGADAVDRIYGEVYKDFDPDDEPDLGDENGGLQRRAAGQSAE